LTKKLAHMVK